jgi:hypothetical protein
MIEIINDLESKGFRICIYPQKNKSVWYWISGVYVGNCRQAEWVENKNESNLPFAAYKSYKSAFDAVTEYCKNYIPKVEKTKSR